MTSLINLCRVSTFVLRFVVVFVDYYNKGPWFKTQTKVVKNINETNIRRESKNLKDFFVEAFKIW